MNKFIVKGEIKQFLFGLLGLTAYCLAITVIRFIVAENYDYWFLAWNLFLAWIPLIASWFLFVRTKKFGLIWSKINIALFTIWLLFLPNAFYIFTDFIHLDRYQGMPETYDIMLIASYSVCGMILGFTSLFMVHKRAIKRFKLYGHLVPLLSLLASGFAIYLGRELRWNSWDMIINPFGILFAVSDILLNPTKYGIAFTTTILFFGFLGISYLITWQAMRMISSRQLE